MPTFSITDSLSTFSATVNLGKYNMDDPGQAQALPISVKSLDSSVRVLSYSPTTVRVVLDVLAEKSVPGSFEQFVLVRFS